MLRWSRRINCSIYRVFGTGRSAVVTLELLDEISIQISTLHLKVLLMDFRANVQAAFSQAWSKANWQYHLDGQASLALLESTQLCPLDPPQLSSHHVSYATDFEVRHACHNLMAISPITPFHALHQQRVKTVRRNSQKAHPIILVRRNIVITRAAHVMTSNIKQTYGKTTIVCKLEWIIVNKLLIIT